MALKKMMDTLRAKKLEYDAQLDALSKDAQKTLSEYLGPLIPAGYVLHWTQYTDYFNDGEPCSFSVHEPELAAAPDGKLPKPYTGQEIGAWALKRYTDNDMPGVTRAILATLSEAWHAIPEDLLERAFGDHVHCGVYSSGQFKVDDYTNHD